jgi:hypothetical protein
MEKKSQQKILKLVVLISFLVMLFINALANILPINGISTGQVSDSYPNLFAPAALTFLIWGLIYLLLAAFILYLFGLFCYERENSGKLMQISLYFAISSVANSLWLLSWHYDLIALSMLLMVILLLCLIKINQLTSDMSLSLKEKFFIRLPFSVYFGWITIATIANATVLLVSLGWGGFGLPEFIWAGIIIIAGTIIGSMVIFKNKDMAYGLALIWAYIGILVKHLSPYGFAGEYPLVIVTTSFCIVVILLDITYMMLSRHKKIKLDIRP